MDSSQRYQPTTANPPSDGTWTASGKLTDARGLHTATLLNDGTVLAAGGIQLPAGDPLYSAERFFPDADLTGCAQLFTRPLTAPLRLGRRLARKLKPTHAARNVSRSKMGLWG